MKICGMKILRIIFFGIICFFCFFKFKTFDAVDLCFLKSCSLFFLWNPALFSFLSDYVVEEWYCVWSWCTFVRFFPRTTAGILPILTKLEIQKKESTEKVLGFIFFLNNKIYSFLSHLYILFIRIMPT